MDLEPIWQSFINRLAENKLIVSADWKKVAGIPFLYISMVNRGSKEELKEVLQTCSAFAMRGKRLHSETIFVRNDRNQYVYRHRFLVPQEKMFCCGNLCMNCTRLKRS